MFWLFLAVVMHLFIKMQTYIFFYHKNKSLNFGLLKL